MKNLALFFILFSIGCVAQNNYNSSAEFRYGRPNPAAEKQIMDYDEMIGICDCLSTTKNTDRTWAKPVNMTWEFKYILNGMGVQDLSFKENGTYSGSIRQYSKDSARWYVHYYSYPNSSPKLPVWEGNRKEDKIILYKKHEAPNGADGFYRITFYDINKNGFEWIGEWVDPSESIVFPTWKISCKKRKE